MKKVYIPTLAALLVFFTSAAGRVVVIPSDYQTIQEGINCCTDGDTVLVKPGIYFENINFNGRNLILSSFYLTSRNPEYIESTIIDGNSSGSVVTFGSGEDASALLIGLTIRNGYSRYGAGIHCAYSSPTICNNIITGNISPSGYYGGGIYCEYSTAVIEYNSINSNMACYGGGIYSIDSDLRIFFNRIIDNSAYE